LIFKENTLNWLSNEFLDISIERFINNNRRITGGENYGAK